MPKIKDVFLNDVAYGLATYISEWVNVSAANYTVFSVYCSGNCDIEIEYSFDDQFQIVETFTTAVLAGNTIDILKQVLTPFQRFKVINIGFPQDLKIQGWFYESDMGLQNLENLGTGAEVYDTLSGIRTFVSSDSTLIITQNPAEIDLTAGPGIATTTLASAGGSYSLVWDGTGPSLETKGLFAGTDISIIDNGVALTINSSTPTTSLTSAGGTYSLINDGTGPSLSNKGLIAGSGVTITDSGSALTINSATTASSVWQETAGVISPITSATAGRLCGNMLTNSIVANSDYSCIVGGDSNQFSTASAIACDRSVIVGGSSNIMRRTDDSVIIGGTNNETAKTNGNNVARSAIIAGTNNELWNTSLNSGIIASSGSNINDGNQCIIGGGTNHAIEQASFLGSSNCGIICGTGSIIRRSQDAVIIGGLGNQMCVTNGNNSFRCGIYNGTNNEIYNTATDSSIMASSASTISQADRSVILGGSNHLITGVSDNSAIIGGSNGTIGPNQSNVWMFTHGTALTSPSSNRFIVKNTSGSIFYSNDAATVGVTLAGGSNSWAPTCDINQKENILEVSYQDILNKVVTLPIYKYNYKGNDMDQCCIGPMAQDWHDESRFRCNDVTIPVMEYVKNEDGESVEVQSKDPLTDELLFETKPAKDPLTIETMDAIGISLACIKSLKEQIDSLNTRIEILESK